MIRERLRPYIRECMRAASETGAPVMRPLFFDFPEDPVCWETEDCYMFGPESSGCSGDGRRSKDKEHLPSRLIRYGRTPIQENSYEGGRTVEVDAPLDIIPVMMREGCSWEIYG